MPKPVPPHLNPLRLKTNLKMAISKLKFTQEKKVALTKQQRRQLAELLKAGKESSAKIRVENIIRDDIYIELLEFLELYCELLLARLNMVLDRPTCDPSLLEAVSSLIYSAQNSDLKELVAIRDILIYKYGTEFGKAALENEGGHVPEKIVRRCGVEPPSEDLVNMYLVEIALAYGVPYSGLEHFKNDEVEGRGGGDDDEGEGGTKESVPQQDHKEKPLAELAEKPSVVASKPQTKPTPKQQDDFDALAARFAALKKTPK
ncbi:IST1 [Candida theae]|uniref:IST1 n=1 Tax=Candida theae TaxID=1198502 RepID=A0AAD5BJI8_9ASCO|nr:IST1 [Candida theae]KAI5968487.1 IST1 [Candida theae]